jgi:hypothetical protein
MFELGPAEEFHTLSERRYTQDRGQEDGLDELLGHDSLQKRNPSPLISAIDAIGASSAGAASRDE